MDLQASQLSENFDIFDLKKMHRNMITMHFPY